MAVVFEANYSIRSYRSSDAATCMSLYHEGLLGGKIADNDTGIDIEHIESAYMPPNHFWVAETNDGHVVGMIGVQQLEAGVGEVRRLRVATPFRRRGIGSTLLSTALKYCQEQQYLKVKLDTWVDHDAALRLFQKFQFLHERTRLIGEKQLMYFYRDLYSQGQGA